MVKPGGQVVSVNCCSNFLCAGSSNYVVALRIIYVKKSGGDIEPYSHEGTREISFGY